MPARADGVKVLPGFPSGCNALPLFPVSPNSCLFSSLQLGCKNLQQPKTLAMSGVCYGCARMHRPQHACSGALLYAHTSLDVCIYLQAYLRPSGGMHLAEGREHIQNLAAV